MTETAPTHRFAKSRVADRIVDDLRDRILTGALPDGARLPAERELAEEYGVSGATVRESIRVLTAMGLVSVQHGTGSFVTAETDTMVQIYVKVAAGRVTQATFRTFGCSACIAASSIATELLVGRTTPPSAFELDTALGGLPADKRYCADLVAEAARRALTPAT